MNNEQFFTEVRRLVSEHGMNAQVFRAIACEACKSDEQYGVVVELTYSYPSELMDTVQVFKWALRQERVQLFVRGDVYPPGFEVSQIAMCKMPTGSRVTHSALTLHNEQRAYLKQFGVNTSIVLYGDKETTNLLSVCDPQECSNFDYWQQCLSGFLKKQGLTSAFYFARVSGC